MTALDIIKAEPIGHERLVLIMDDLAAQRVLIGWTIYRPKGAEDYTVGKRGTTFEAAWELCWSHVDVNFEKLERLTGIPYTICVKVFYRLQAANLIYPDGTIAPVASELIAGLMRAHIRGMSPKGKRNG